MPKYVVYLQTVASTSAEVEADSKEDAYEAALAMDMPRICAQCAGWGKSEGQLSLELGEEWDIDQRRGIEKAVQEIG